MGYQNSPLRDGVGWAIRTAHCGMALGGLPNSQLWDGTGWAVRTAHCGIALDGLSEQLTEGLHLMSYQNSPLWECI